VRSASLDGYIAGPDGEIDWIVRNPTIDWASVFMGFDTGLLGRRTYELTQQPDTPAWPAGWHVYVFSRTLDAVEHPGDAYPSGIVSLHYDVQHAAG
jgi:dihydrofolate reductase